MDKLKEEADKAYRVQRFTAVNEYIEKVSAKIDVLFKKARLAASIHMGVCVFMMISGFFHNPLMTITALLLMLLSMGRMAYWDRKLSRQFGEFHGALKVLHLLGLLDFDPDETMKRAKKRRFAWLDGLNLVKKWSADKKAAQDKVFAPV